MSVTSQEQPLTEEDMTRLKGNLQLERAGGYTRVGPKGYFLPKAFESLSPHLTAFQPRPTDTWVVSFPRSGTTVTQEMVWIIANNLDFETAKKVPLRERFPYLEMSMLYPEETVKLMKQALAMDPKKLELIEKTLCPNHKKLEAMSGRRFIKSHLPFSLLPSNLLEVGAKVVYVARNPKDVSVSCFHLSRMSSHYGNRDDFLSYWDDFESNETIFSPYWSHLKEGWEHKSHPNVLFLIYEDIVKDTKGTINKVADFLKGSHLADEDSDLVAKHLNIEKFRKNQSVNYSEATVTGLLKAEDGKFIRKGVVGGYVEQFTPELTKRADKWIEENLMDFDFRFPIM